MLVSRDGDEDGLSDVNMDVLHNDVHLEIRLDVLRNNEPNILNC